MTPKQKEALAKVAAELSALSNEEFAARMEQSKKSDLYPVLLEMLGSRPPPPAPSAPKEGEEAQERAWQPAEQRPCGYCGQSHYTSRCTVTEIAQFAHLAGALSEREKWSATDLVPQILQAKDKDATISALKARVAEATEIIKSTTPELEELKAELHWRKAEVSTLTDECATLKARIAELEAQLAVAVKALGFYAGELLVQSNSVAGDALYEISALQPAKAERGSDE